MPEMAPKVYHYILTPVLRLGPQFLLTFSNGEIPQKPKLR